MRRLLTCGRRDEEAQEDKVRGDPRGFLIGIAISVILLGGIGGIIWLTQAGR